MHNDHVVNDKLTFFRGYVNVDWKEDEVKLKDVYKTEIIYTTSA